MAKVKKSKQTGSKRNLGIRAARRLKKVELKDLSKVPSQMVLERIFYSHGREFYEPKNPKFNRHLYG